MFRTILADVELAVVLGVGIGLGLTLGTVGYIAVQIFVSRYILGGF